MHPLRLVRSANLALPFHGVPSKAWFRMVLRVVGKLHTFIRIEDVESYLYDGKQLRGGCHVSFDDGDRTMYEQAFPVLHELGIPATVFVSPRVIREQSNYWFQELNALKARVGEAALRQAACERLGCRDEQLKPFGISSVFKCMPLQEIRDALQAVKDQYQIDIPERYNLTAAQLEEVSRSPLMTIGAHTMNHPILQNERHEEAEREIRDSVDGLSAMLNRPIRYFAYPNGIPDLDYGPREQHILREAGITLAFSSSEDFFDKRTNPLSIPRGGCPRLAEESTGRMVSRLALLPIWQTMRRIAARGGQGDEVRERQALRTMLAAPTAR